MQTQFDVLQSFDVDKMAEFLANVVNVAEDNLIAQLQAEGVDVRLARVDQSWRVRLYKELLSKTYCEHDPVQLTLSKEFDSE